MKFTRMRFLLIFFPEEHHHPSQHKKQPHVGNPFSSSSQIHRTNSSNLLLLKAQSTISICLLFVFLTLLLFTLSTLPASSPSPSSARRLLQQHQHQLSPPVSNLSHALQKMGTLYRQGTRAMNDVVVAHVPESLTPYELKLFVRLFYRSSLASRSDLVFVFPTAKSPDFDDMILHENDLFLKLLDRYGEIFSSNNSNSTQGFDVTHFMKSSKKEKEIQEPIWGRRNYKRNSSEEEGGESTKSTRPSYGSVVGFDVDELDQENSLSGFLGHVPMSLRRWACYPMLLGRVKRSFKYIMLIDVKEILLLGDPLGRVRNLSPESVHLKLATPSSSGKHGRRSPARPKPVHPGIVMGVARGVRRLANEMLMIIVRGSMQQQRKKKSLLTESALFNQLVGNEFILKNVNLVTATESVPELSSLSGPSAKSGTRNFNYKYSVVRRANSKLEFNYLVIKHLCSFPIESTVYSDC